MNYERKVQYWLDLVVETMSARVSAHIGEDENLIKKALWGSCAISIHLIFQKSKSKGGIKKIFDDLRHHDGYIFYKKTAQEDECEEIESWISKGELYLKSFDITSPMEIEEVIASLSGISLIDSRSILALAFVFMMEILGLHLRRNGIGLEEVYDLFDKFDQHIHNNLPSGYQIILPVQP